MTTQTTTNPAQKTPMTDVIDKQTITAGEALIESLRTTVNAGASKLAEKIDSNRQRVGLVCAISPHIAQIMVLHYLYHLVDTYDKAGSNDKERFFPWLCGRLENLAIFTRIVQAAECSDLSTKEIVELTTTGLMDVADLHKYTEDETLLQRIQAQAEGCQEAAEAVAAS